MSDTATSSPAQKNRDTNLPMKRIKTIMKSSPDVESVNQESLFMMTKATELFIMYLSKLAQRNGSDVQLIYGDLVDVANRKDSMEFLRDILPPKVKYSEFLELIKAKEKSEAQSDDEDDVVED